MVLEDAGIWLPVTSWHHDMTHDGEKLSWRQMRVSARSKPDEEMVLGGDGWRSMRDLWFSLTLVRGKPEKPIERGVGVMSYHAARNGDVAGMGEVAVETLSQRIRAADVEMLSALGK